MQLREKVFRESQDPENVRELQGYSNSFFRDSRDALKPHAVEAQKNVFKQNTLTRTKSFHKDRLVGSECGIETSQQVNVSTLGNLLLFSLLFFCFFIIFTVFITQQLDLR